MSRNYCNKCMKDLDQCECYLSERQVAPRVHFEKSSITLNLPDRVIAVLDSMEKQAQATVFIHSPAIEIAVTDSLMREELPEPVFCCGCTNLCCFCSDGECGEDEEEDWEDRLGGTDDAS